jgi:hypothetical protein
MGARWMQQKLQKMKKARKAYLKPYSLHMRNRKPPNKDVIKEYKERGKSLPDPWLDTLFPGIQQRNVPRQEAIRRRDELIKEEADNEFSTQRIVLGQSKNFLFVCYFAVHNGPAYFVHYDLRLNRLKKSQIYSNLHSAKVVYQMEQIQWKNWEPFGGAAPS